ncbi:MAG: glycosyltransferase family 39 protein [Anaerolineales bacterium]|nr:glycosyltransferase family 39 protein [Anaerolineales bacterium]
MLVGFGLGLFGQHYNDFTVDEPAHIAAGYAALARGSQARWLLPEHLTPPLLNALEALPVYLAQPRVALEALPGWGVSFPPYVRALLAVLEQTWPPPQLQLLTRLPVIWLAALLAAVIFRWGKDMWGEWGGRLALFSLVSDPNLIAHGQLATTDAGLAALGTATLFCVWRWRRRPRWRLGLLSGGLLGLTLLSKYSGGLWLLAAGLVVLTTLGQRRSSLRPGWVASSGLGLLLIGLLAPVAVYGIGVWTYRGLNLPLPAAEYWAGVLAQAGSSGARWAYAFGFRGYTHWWWYFPAAFLIKNPLPWLLLLGVALAALVRHDGRRLVALALFPAGYGLVAMESGLNIGYRHLLPVHPFLHLLVGGGLWVWLQARPRSVGRLTLCAGLALWSLLSVLLVWPYELTYFNEVSGGPAAAYQYLTDSNLDWGQTPPEVLDQYAQAHPGLRRSAPAARWRPEAGLYLVGASALQGLSPGDPFAYEWFRHQAPTAHVNAAWLVYAVPELELGWVAQCSRPVAPLDEPTIVHNSGLTDLRQLSFDCSQAWVYPTGGAAGGYYAFDHSLYQPLRLQWPSLLAGPPSPTDAFLQRHLSATQVIFDKSHVDTRPAYVLHSLARGAVMPPLPAGVYPAPADTAPLALVATDTLVTPAGFESGLSLIGTQVRWQADELEVETWWRVEADLSGRGFSIMAHLLDADGAVLAVADGLGVAPLDLARGDVWLQRHRFALPLTSGPFWLRTGGYWLDDLSRWTVTGWANTDALFLPLMP